MKYAKKQKMKLSKNKEEITMKKEEIINLFTENAAGINGMSKRDSYFPLTVFVEKMEEKYPTLLKGTEDELYHLKEQIDAIVPDLAVNMLDHPQEIHLLDYYMYIINHWNKLKGWSVTYRLLADLVRLASWDCPTNPTQEHCLKLALEQSGISGEANL